MKGLLVLLVLVSACTRAPAPPPIEAAPEAGPWTDYQPKPAETPPWEDYPPPAEPGVVYVEPEEFERINADNARRAQVREDARVQARAIADEFEARD